MADYNSLYVGSKWCDSYAPHGVSNSKHNIIGSLEATGLAKCQWFAFDEFYDKHEKPGDEALIELCKDNKFDFIILDWAKGAMRLAPKDSPYCGVIEGREFVVINYPWVNPTDETLDILNHQMNIPIVGLAWDTVWGENIEAYEKLLSLNCVSFYVVLDNTHVLYVVEDPSRYLALWTPQDPALFYDPGVETKTIPISFMGRLHKPARKTVNRKERLDAFETAGIKIFHAGGQRESTATTPEKYASYIRNSKIMLNLPASHSGISQLTGRTMEITLSNSMLLEEINLETLRYFIPMVDYVPFQSDVDMVVKAKYFMEHDEERIRIAENGYRKASKHYNSKVFWEIVLGKLFNA